MNYTLEEVASATQKREFLDLPKRLYRGCLLYTSSFNIASMSFTPKIIYKAVKAQMPDFTMDYNVDPVKEAIAKSWPNSLDDTCAREEWGWKPEWDLSRMTDDMLAHIRTKLAAE